MSRREKEVLAHTLAGKEKGLLELECTNGFNIGFGSLRPIESREQRIIKKFKRIKTKSLSTGKTCVLVGNDRATGEDAEQIDESDAAMYVEHEDGGHSKDTSGSSTTNKKVKKDKDRLVDAVTSFAYTFRQYVERQNNLQPPRPSCTEIHTVVSSVPGILSHQILRAVKRFMSGTTDEFQMLKDLPNEDKLEWVILCLGD